MRVEARKRLSEDGRVVISSSFRKALGMNVGDDVILRIDDGEIRITTLKRRLERASKASGDI